MRDTGISADERCPGSATMGNAVGGGARIPLGSTGTTTFTAPTGMTIADFTLTRQLTYRNGAPADGTRRLYALYALGGTVFAGAGHYENATRNRLNAVGSWYGYPEKNIVVPTSSVSRASFPALAGYAGTATTLQIAVGCFNGSVNTACSVAAGGGISNLLSGARVVLYDPTAPMASIEASGLLAGGGRSGSDPVTLDATDNGGIRRVELIDVSASGSRVVGFEDYAAGGRTATGDTCSFRLRKACPNLRDETVRPTSLPAGPRTLKVRITDAGGNVTEQGPYAVSVATPSDRGPLNGTGATEDGTLSAHFSGSTKKRRTVSYRARVRISGRLLNSAGRPVAGALLRVLTRDRRQGARFVERYTTTTDSDGIYRVRVRAAASRLTQIAWRSHDERSRLPGERLRDPGRARLVLAEGAPAHGRGGRAAAPDRHGARHGPVARRPADLPGPHGARALHDVRRRPRRPQGPLQRPLSLPLRRLARAHVQLPRQAPRRRPLPLRARLLQARDRSRPLRPGPKRSRFPPRTRTAEGDTG